MSCARPLLVVAFWLLSAFPLLAQDNLDSITQALRQAGMSDGTAVRVPLPTTLLAGAVDPAQYRLGPGDELEILVLGETVKRSFEWVGPSGSLTISPGGSIAVDGLTLLEADALVAERLAPYYTEGAEVQVRLSNIRVFRVRVVGDVLHPGEFLATPFTRVTDVLDEAQGRARVDATGLRFALPTEETAPTLIEVAQGEPVALEEEEMGLEEPPEPMEEEVVLVAPERRRVLLIRDGARPLRIDAVGARLGWQGAENPTLSGGDLISVPMQRDFIYIEGAVYRPGEYELLPGDSALQLLHMAGGVTMAAADYLIVKRDGREGARMLVDRQRAAMALLESGDRVYVPSASDRESPATVTIQGAVAYPGVYPLLPDQDRVQDLLLLAGGFTSDAVARETYIVREGDDLRLDPVDTRIRYTPEEVQEHEEFEYRLQRRFLAARVVYVDIEDLEEPGDNPLLRRGDVIRVPSRDEMVYVSGAVLRPGGFALVAGATYEYYLQRAGGVTERARLRKRSLIAASSGAWGELDEDTEIRPGDTIWIPGKVPRDWWEIFREVVTVTGQIATTYLVIDNITSR